MGALSTECSDNSFTTFKEHDDPHSTLRRCIKLAVTTALVATILGICSIAIPICLIGSSMDVTETDVVTSVIAGAALRLDCSDLSQTVGNLVQVTWRKNMQRFYQQYSSGGRYRGHPTDEVGGRLESRLKSLAVGEITLFPALPEDADTYLCEVARVSDASSGTQILRKSFGVSIVSGPQVDLPVVAETFAGTVVGAILLFSVFRLLLRRWDNHKLEIETKCEEEILDEDIVMPTCVRSPSRSSRDRSASSRRRRSSSASAPAKRSSSRVSAGGAAAQQVESRRSTTPTKGSKRSGSATSVAEESEFAPTPNELRVIQSYTNGKPQATRKQKTAQKGALRKGARRVGRPALRRK